MQPRAAREVSDRGSHAPLLIDHGARRVALPRHAPPRSPPPGGALPVVKGLCVGGAAQSACLRKTPVWATRGRADLIKLQRIRNKREVIGPHLIKLQRIRNKRNSNWTELDRNRAGNLPAGSRPPRSALPPSLNIILCRFQRRFSVGEEVLPPFNRPSRLLDQTRLPKKLS